MSDEERFAAIDAVRVTPFAGRMSDKRTALGAKRFVRVKGTNSLLLAACGCYHQAPKPGTICVVCGGAELTREELTR